MKRDIPTISPVNATTDSADPAAGYGFVSASIPAPPGAALVCPIIDPSDPSDPPDFSRGIIRRLPATDATDGAPAPTL